MHFIKGKKKHRGGYSSGGGLTSKPSTFDGTTAHPVTINVGHVWYMLWVNVTVAFALFLGWLLPPMMERYLRPQWNCYALTLRCYRMEGVVLVMTPASVTACHQVGVLEP